MALSVLQMRLPAFSSAILMVALGLPANADVPDSDGVCDGDEAANGQCKVVAGPGSVRAMDLESLGTAFCQRETTDVPLQCEGSAGDLNGYGGATFGDAMWAGPKSISANVKHDQEACTDTTSPPCGFAVEICNDRDQDSNCTNIGDQDDELYHTSAGQGALGECDDAKLKCADPNEAGWSGCMGASTFADWSTDQIVVFISTEAEVSMSADLMAAVSAGTYTIWVQDDGPCDEEDAGTCGLQEVSTDKERYNEFVKIINEVLEDLDAGKAANEKKWIRWHILYVIWHESFHGKLRAQQLKEGGEGPARGIIGIEAHTLDDRLEQYINNPNKAGHADRIAKLAKAAGVRVEKMQEALDDFQSSSDPPKPNNGWPKDGQAANVEKWLRSCDKFSVLIMRYVFKSFGDDHQFPPANAGNLPNNPQDEAYKNEHFESWAEWWWKGDPALKEARKAQFMGSAKHLDETSK